MPCPCRCRFLQILGTAGDDQRRGGIEDRDVAERSLLAFQYALERDGIAVRIAAAQGFGPDLRDTDIVQRMIDDLEEGATLAESNSSLERMVERIHEQMERTGVRLLWGTANLFGHPRYAAGAATNPDPSHLEPQKPKLV